MPNAYQLKCLPAMGVNIHDLGCVMLDVEPIDLRGAIPEEWAYTSTNPKLSYVSGIQEEAHITLLFGLLQNANLIRSAVDEVLEGWEPGPISVWTIDAFPSPLPEEPYVCLVAKIWGQGLKDAHARLSLLPHINTFPEYQPHLTLAYVHKDHANEAIRAVENALGALDGLLSTPVEPLGLNYGRMPS